MSSDSDDFREAPARRLRRAAPPPPPPPPRPKRAKAAPGGSAEAAPRESDGEDGFGPLTQLAAAGGGGGASPAAAVATAFCPACGDFLADLAAGSEAQRRHVDACVAAGGDGEDSWGSDGGGAEGAEPRAGGGGGNFSEDEAGDGDEGDGDEGADAGAAADALLEEEQPADGGGAPPPEAAGTGGGGGEAGGGAVACHPAVAGWLAAHGLAKYAPAFARARADPALVPLLTDADLRAMGLAALGARKKVLVFARELADAAAAEQHQQQRAEQQPATGLADWRAVAPVRGGGVVVSRHIAGFFGGRPPPAAPAPRQQENAAPPGSILRFLPGGAAAAAAAAAARPPPAGRAAPWAHKAVQASAGTRGAAFRGGGGGRRAEPAPFRPWQLVAGTGIVVDRFDRLPPPEATARLRHWVLTHFHADHYKGLGPRFDRGTVYCTPVTAALAAQQLRVPPGRLRAVPLGAPFDLGGARATFLEANHCPGAAMVLFERPGRPPLLHTGDARLAPAVYRSDPVLARLPGAGAELVLDTTYCAPQYAFPPQAEVLRFVVDAVRAEAFNPKVLFMFGSYTIGKERLYLEAARALGRRVYVSATKMRVLRCLALPPEHAALLTTDDGATNLHAVPLWMVTHKHMAAALKFYRGRFDTVVGFAPTGWAHEREAGAARARGRRRQKGTVVTYSVPYSEHSSFPELAAFVRWLAPRSIVPHVNADAGGPKARALVDMLRAAAAAGVGAELE